MGYYTRYRLNYDEVNPSKRDTIEYKLTDISGYPVNTFYNGEPVKWYDWEDNMKELSVEFPDIVFSLYGEGEENDDIWKAYFKNGKYKIHNVVISFPDFKESDLSDTGR